MTTTGYEKRIAAAAPHLSRSKCQRLALKLAKRAEHMQAEFDFYAELRVLGIHTDASARKSIEPEYEPTRHINDRLPWERINRQETAA